MSGQEVLMQIDPGTGLTLGELIDAFISNPREAKSLKAYLLQNKTGAGSPDDRRHND